MSPLLYLFALVIVYLGLQLMSRPSKLPPGPPRAWFFQRVIPDKYPFLQFEEWIKQYGPVFSLKRGSSVVVVIGRYQEAIDILEKCGAQTSDRPRSIAASEVYSGGLRPLLLSNTSVWKVMSRAQHAHLQPKAAHQYELIQFAAAKKLIMGILDDPQEYLTHIRMFSMTIILTLSHGITEPSFTSHEVQLMLLSGVRFGQVVRPGAFLVDAIPLLKHMPEWAYPPLKTLRAYFRDEYELFRDMLGDVRKRTASAGGQNEQQCFAQYLLENQETLNLTENQLNYLAGTMFGAGFETTASTMTFMLMAAATFPDAVKRVQAQIDTVVGKDRCPTFEDRDDLTQVTAFILERSRWRPVFGGGIPHCASEDIIWNGYTIPKGAMVIGSHWSIFRDPSVFPNPEVFDPQRWITTDETGKEIVRKDLRDFTFGFGRRACPGMHVANRSLFIATAMLFWAFDVLPNPKHPIDTMAFTNTLNARTEPFEVIFKERQGSGKVRETLY